MNLNLKDLESSQIKMDNLINKIIENPDNYDKAKLMKLVDSMKDLVKLAEIKLVKK